MKMRVQIIKVYEVEVPDSLDPTAAVYAMQTSQIEETGELIDVMTDHAEVSNRSAD